MDNSNDKNVNSLIHSREQLTLNFGNSERKERMKEGGLGKKSLKWQHSSMKVWPSWWGVLEPKLPIRVIPWDLQEWVYTSTPAALSYSWNRPGESRFLCEHGGGSRGVVNQLYSPQQEIWAVHFHGSQCPPLKEHRCPSPCRFGEQPFHFSHGL